MRILGKVFSLILLMWFLENLGAGLNRFVMANNHGQMPVLLWDGAHISPMDFRHADMTPQSKYKVLCDIIPLPFFHSFIILWDVESLGDVLINTGDMMLFFIPIVLFKEGKKYVSRNNPMRRLQSANAQVVSRLHNLQSR